MEPTEDPRATATSLLHEETIQSIGSSMDPHVFKCLTREISAFTIFGCGADDPFLKNGELLFLVTRELSCIWS